MANLKLKCVWKLLNEYKFDFCTPVSSDFLCVICKAILKNPYQSPCGCRYCMECIVNYLKDNKNHCPGQMDDCKEQLIDFSQDLQMDYIINRKISMMQVKCPDKFCEFKDELKNIENHINSHTEPCPYLNVGCDISSLQRKYLLNHLNSDNYAHSKLLVESFVTIKNEIISLKETLELTKQNSERKNKLFIEMENRLNDLLVCQKEEINQLHQNVSRYETENNKLNEELEAALTKVEYHKKICEEKQAVFEQLQQKTKELQLSLNIEKVKSINDKENKFPNLVIDNNYYYAVQYVLFKYSPFKWKIDQFKKKLEDAKNGICHVLTSESFYSHIEGYKLYLTLHPNGFGPGTSTHVSVFLHIMKGEFDEKLSWPVSLTCRISLVDQNFGNLYNENISKCTPSFQNVKFGEAKFITLDMLFNNTRIYANDSFLIRCSVR